MGEREKPLNLLDFPYPLLDRILDMVVHPGEGHRVNLDNDKKINCGLIHVNRELYRRWRDEVLFRDNSFELALTTNSARNDFDQFKHLRRFLRKTYDIRTFYVTTRTAVAGENVNNKMEYTLKFDHDTCRFSRLSQYGVRYPCNMRHCVGATLRPWCYDSTTVTSHLSSTARSLRPPHYATRSPITACLWLLARVNLCGFDGTHLFDRSGRFVALCSR
ncbi:hypothetical protein BKA58DRAFT_66551 [Alternaria rosae]|uniref:uncharacterized protein n=1 Tax=Alternaria rosae TaxID=1187941 RepID=UPI001E8E1DF3|nr:uncharacterized protein BKA58DRAFT_66551 [Alternaria rosae]KAH6853022.1 hypothetical protein BKA58DRAFT_66551 [Alternaria rosae]